MITFGYYWKKELVRLADRLQKRSSQKRWTFPSTASLEKEVFVGAYSVRKLMESDKVSPSIAGRPVTLTFYPIRREKGEEPPKHFTHRFELGGGVRQELKIEHLMNQFIHSYYFSPFVPFGKNMAGIFVASDRDRKMGLYYITLGNLSAIFRRVGNESVSSREIDQLLEGESLWGGRE